jgi:uncharacterized membrane protein YkvA (DUF1232 family)
MGSGSMRRGAMRWGALRSLGRAFRTAVRPGTPGMGERLTAVPRLVSATFRGDYPGTSSGRLVAIFAAILYVVSPVDLVPELVLPLLGLADDAVVISWVAASLINETESFLGWERDRDRTVQGEVIP